MWCAIVCALLRYFELDKLAQWAGVVDADTLPDRRWVLIRLERSQRFVRAQVTDVTAGGVTYEVVEPRSTVEWAMGGEFEANKAANFAERLVPVLPPVDLADKPITFNRLNPLQPPTSFFVCGNCRKANEVPGVGVLGAETFKVKQALWRAQQKSQRGGDYEQQVL